MLQSAVDRLLNQYLLLLFFLTKIVVVKTPDPHLVSQIIYIVVQGCVAKQLDRVAEHFLKILEKVNKRTHSASRQDFLSVDLKRVQILPGISNRRINLIRPERVLNSGQQKLLVRDKIENRVLQL